MNRSSSLALLACLSLLPTAAIASPHALPYSYPYATNGKGETEVEQYVDMTPVPTYDSTGASPTSIRAVLVTEIEYGLTDRLEGGFYLQATTDTGAGTGSVPLRFDGVMQRLRYRIADPGVLPVDLSVYGEIAEFSTEIELEAKLNLEKRLGPVQILVNLWAEREFYYAGQQEWVLNPTAGFSVDITPSVHLGLEYWMHAEYGATVNANNAGGGASTAFNPGDHHYLGPALMVQGNRLWLAVAPYLRLDDWGRSAQVGDQYGRFWVRAIVGFEL